MSRSEQHKRPFLTEDFNCQTGMTRIEMQRFGIRRAPALSGAESDLWLALISRLTTFILSHLSVHTITGNGTTFRRVLLPCSNSKGCFVRRVYWHCRFSGCHHQYVQANIQVTPTVSSLLFFHHSIWGKLPW